METHNQAHKTKIRVMNSIMKHPKLSRSFSDAMRAPIGSTKRKHVKSIVDVMGKVYTNSQDGAGGPGVSTMSPVVGTSTPANGYSALSGMTGVTTSPNIIIPSAPLPWSGAVSNTGMQGSSSTPQGIYQTPTPAYNQGKNLLSLNGTPPPQTNQNYGLPTPNFSMQNGAAGVFNQNLPATQFDSLARSLGGQNAAAPRGYSTIWDQAVQSGDTSKLFPTSSETPGSQQGGGNQSGGSSSSSSSYSGGGDIGLPTGKSSGGYTSGSLESAAQQAANNNTGGAMFAMKMMQDKEMLKQLYPNTPEDQLPVGASLSDQVNKLADHLKNEFHIDQLGAQLSSKIQAGVSLPSDISAYIRGKDQIIGHLDSMLQDVQDKLPTMDLNDPMKAASMKSYQNYLLIMKGRANQRYVDWAQTSVDQFSSQIQAINNQYNTAKDLYTSAFTSQSAAKTEDYNRTYTLLTDLYNNISTAPDKELQRQMVEAQLLSAKQSIIASAAQLDAANLQTTLAQTGGGASLASSITGGLFTPEEATKAFDFVNKSFSDSKGDLSSGLSLNNILQNTAKMGLPASAVLFAYSNLLGKKLQSATDQSEVARIQKQINEVFARPDVKQIMKDYPDSSFNLLQQEFSSAAGSATQKNILSNIDVYRTAIDDIFKPTGFGLIGAKTVLRTKEDWMSRHTDLPKGVAETIYNKIAAQAGISKNSYDSVVSAIYKGDLGGTTAWTKMDDNTFASTIGSLISS